MIDKKGVQKSLTALEDIKGLYSELEQLASDQEQKQKFKTMLEDIEKQYQYLNAVFIACK